MKAPTFEPEMPFKYVVTLRIIQGIIMDVLIFYDMNMTRKNGSLQLLNVLINLV